MTINPQAFMPEERRNYCEKCGVLLADYYYRDNLGNKHFICNRCYKP